MNDMLLAVAISVNGATRLEIDHVPNSVSYRTALSPSDLDERARIRIESRDPATIARRPTCATRFACAMRAVPRAHSFISTLSESAGWLTDAESASPAMRSNARSSPPFRR
jgi:hypothetical protein